MEGLQSCNLEVLQPCNPMPAGLWGSPVQSGMRIIIMDPAGFSSCTAIRNLGHSPNPACDTITVSLKGASDDEMKKITPDFKAAVVLAVLRSESAEVSEPCRYHNNRGVLT